MQPEQCFDGVEPMYIDDVVLAFRKWLFLPDALSLLAVLGTVAANLLEGDPVWLLLVGPPGSGKSEILQSVGGLPNVHPAATLTEPALLSGTARKERDANAKGGLLKAIGDFGIILCKDFGSVLSMHRDARAQVMAALREIYDGSWTRHVGVDGGKTLSWAGKVGLVAGCTPTIDRHHAVMGAMGERFVLMRQPDVDGAEQAKRALSHAGKERAMRGELSQAVAGLFTPSLATPPELDDDERARLIALATLVVRCRSAVERDSHTREIELVPGSEAPTRLIVVLERLLAGLAAIYVDRETAWTVVIRAGLDSMPALRRSVIETLWNAIADVDTTAIADDVRHPTQTTRRALEDLTAHGVVGRVTEGKGNAPHTWALTGWAREQYAAALCVPETSGGSRNGRVPEMSEGAGDPSSFSFPTYDDISGTQNDVERLAELSLDAQALVAEGDAAEVGALEAESEDLMRAREGSAS